MPRGRPKGSTGNYFRWPPERIADLFWDAERLAPSWDAERQAPRQKGPNKRLLAKRLKQEFPDKYQHDTIEQMRQQLCKAYQCKRKLDDVDAFNARVWARLLDEA